MSTLGTTLQSAEAPYHEKVIQATWGHLAPRKNKSYPGLVVFAVGCFGNAPLNPIPISCDFEGLDSSPWFYEALMEYLRSLKCDEGTVCQFEGVFRNYEFKGTVRRLEMYLA